MNEISFVDDAEPSTAHMREFAARTHQTGTTSLAKDYLAANIEHAAMPVRTERWMESRKREHPHTTTRQRLLRAQRHGSRRT